MIAWSVYVDSIRPYLPNCPDVLLRDSVMESAAEFCAETLCWQDTASFSVAPNERDIPFAALVTQPNTVVQQIMWLGNADFPNLLPRTQFWLDRNCSGWRTDLGQPKFYTMPVSGTTLWLAPHTDTLITLNCVVALKPAQSSTDGPDDLFEENRIAIQNGAIAIAADVPGKPWSNPAYVQRYGGLYNAAKGPALIKATRGNTRAPLRTTSNFRL
jgi:hypothetical protein